MCLNVFVMCVERSLLHKLKLYCKTQRFDYLVFRYERDLSLLQSWLNRCESLCSSDSPYLTTDDVKLQPASDAAGEVRGHFRDYFNTLGFFFKILMCEMWLSVSLINN